MQINFPNCANATFIIQVATVAYMQGRVQAYHTVYEVEVAVGGSLALLALFAPNVDHLMSDKITVTVHRKKDEKQWEAGVAKGEEIAPAWFTTVFDVDHRIVPRFDRT